MKEISVIVGGRAGDGITNAGAIVAQLFNHLGYYVYTYTDYPSLIRGGHNFALIRAADMPIGAYNNRIDYLIALNQETATLHLQNCPDCTVVANADLVKSLQSGQTISINTILKEESAPPIMGNSAMIGAFAKSAGIPWDIVGEVFRRHMPKAADENIRVAKRAYDQIQTIRTVSAIPGGTHSMLSGNEAIGLGLVAGGLTTYISYPMTPSSSLLHYLARECRTAGDHGYPPGERDRGHPYGPWLRRRREKDRSRHIGRWVLPDERRAFVCRYCRIPASTSWSPRERSFDRSPDVHWPGGSSVRAACRAGRVSPARHSTADPGEAYIWSAAAICLAWKYQIPAFVLADKTLSEGIYSVDYDKLVSLPAPEPVLWNGDGIYQHTATPRPVSRLLPSQAGKMRSSR